MTNIATDTRSGVIVARDRECGYLTGCDDVVGVITGAEGFDKGVHFVAVYPYVFNRRNVCIFTGARNRRYLVRDYRGLPKCAAAGYMFLSLNISITAKGPDYESSVNDSYSGRCFGIKFHALNFIGVRTGEEYT